MKVSRQKYNDSQMTESNSLANALLQNPAKLSPLMTYLGGRQDKKFPLSVLTEGAGNTISIEKDTYEYNVMTRIDHTRPVANSVGTNKGSNGEQFTVEFPDKWFVKDYNIIGPSGVQCRIMSEPVPSGSNYEYTLQVVEPNPNVAVPSEDLTAGAQWGQLYANVGKDFSRGNASNFSTPSKIRHKLSTLRKSYQMSGEAKDFVMDIELPTKSGGNSRYWMDHEEWQKYLQWKEEMEMHYWYGRQTYNENGVTNLVDERNQPIISGPGLFQQIQNRETYSRLTASKLKNVIGDIFYSMTDSQNRQVTLFTGTGGMREFDRAMKEELGRSNYTVLDQDKFVTGSGRNLSLGGFFTTYEHVDGHTVNVVKVPLFDHGMVARTRPKHPETGYSLESYRMTFVDQSNYDGEPNLVMVNKKGREMLRWAVAGSTIPNGFPQGNTLRATDVDGAEVHFLKQCGICLRRFDTSVDMQCIAQ